jgi:hypothetical protein
MRTTEAIRLLANAGRYRLLDTAYGPQSQQLRADVLSALLGERVNKSDKRVQWGNWRRAMIEAVGASGGCIADQDSDFESRARALLGETVAA